MPSKTIKCVRIDPSALTMAGRLIRDITGSIRLCPWAAQLDRAFDVHDDARSQVQPNVAARLTRETPVRVSLSLVSSVPTKPLMAAIAPRVTRPTKNDRVTTRSTKRFRCQLRPDRTSHHALTSSPYRLHSRCLVQLGKTKAEIAWSGTPQTSIFCCDERRSRKVSAGVDLLL